MLMLEVDVATQSMRVLEGDRLIKTYAVSTAKNGVGQEYGSQKTPIGWHIIRAKVGAGASPNTVFVGRRPTGEIYTQALREANPERDWILTRILWLSGLEVGKNRLGSIDTMRRYVYIHGAPDEAEMGKPGSHGCIRMRNEHVIELFDMIPVGTRILITG